MNNAYKSLTAPLNVTVYLIVIQISYSVYMPYNIGYQSHSELLLLILFAWTIVVTESCYCFEIWKLKDLWIFNQSALDGQFYIWFIKWCVLFYDKHVHLVSQFVIKGHVGPAPIIWLSAYCWKLMFTLIWLWTHYR